MKRTVFLSLALFSLVLVSKTSHAYTHGTRLCSFDDIKENVLSRVLGDPLPISVATCFRYQHTYEGGYTFFEFPFEAYANFDGQTYHFSYATMAIENRNVAYLGLRYRGTSHQSYRDNDVFGIVFAPGKGMPHLDRIQPSTCGSSSLIAYINSMAATAIDPEIHDFEFDPADFGWERGCLDDTQYIGTRAMRPGAPIGESRHIIALAPLVLIEEYDGVEYRLLIRRVELAKNMVRYFVDDTEGSTNGYDNMAFIKAVQGAEGGVRGADGSSHAVNYDIPAGFYKISHAAGFGWQNNHPMHISVVFKYKSNEEEGEMVYIDMANDHPTLLAPAPFVGMEQFNN